MSFLIFLRDRVLPYILLICIIIGVGGSFVWVFMQTYFWNTSQLTFIVDEEITTAKIHISARILFVDIPLFWGGSYPIHISLPYNRTVSCLQECILTDVPAGDAQVTLIDGKGVARSREELSIKPDTQGVIDRRVSIRVREVPVSEISTIQGDTSKTSIKIEKVFYRNSIQGLWLLYDSGRLFLYDVAAGQSILLPDDTQVRTVFRGIQEGEYYLVTRSDEVLLYDRYGRKKTEIVTHSFVSESDLVWENRDDNITTRLRIGDKERVLYGRFFWHSVENTYYLFDGNKIFEIINR